VEALQEKKAEEWSRVNSTKCLTVDEKRQALGYDPIGGEGGDLVIGDGFVITAGGEVLVSPMLAPIAEGPPERPPAGAPGAPGGPSGEEAPPEGEPGAGRAAKAYRFDEGVKRARWQMTDRRRQGFRGAAKAEVAGVFQAERKRLVAALKGAAPGANLESVADEQISASSEDWKRSLEKIYVTTGRAFYEDTWRSLAGKASKPPERKTLDDQWMGHARRYVREKTGDKIVQISNTTQDKVKAIIGKGFGEGLSSFQLAEVIDKLYLDEIIPHRSEVIARTEVIQASNSASLDAARDSGVVARKAWLSTRDDRTRQPPDSEFDHAAADGQEVGLEEPFNVSGESLMFPGDTSMGASAGNTIQCRCTLTYVTTKE